jgi:hypothetical protein
MCSEILEFTTQIKCSNKSSCPVKGLEEITAN